MQINITYAASVANAPAGFQTAVQAAVQFFENTFDSPITVNITFGWGEVGGQTLGGSDLGASLTTYVDLPNHTNVAAALANQDGTPADVMAVQTLQTPDAQTFPVGQLSYAQARIFGYVPALANVSDGYVGLNASAPFTFDPNNRAVAGKYDAIGALEHEISEVLGRSTFDGQPPPGGGAPVYSFLDGFRYSAPDVHTYTTGASYFSLNGDQLLLPFNDPSNSGDPGDWSPNVTGDSFDAFGDLGLQENVSTVDLRVMELLGYHFSPTAPTPNGVPDTPLTLTQNFQVASNQTVGVDGPFAVLMQQDSPAFTVTNAGTIVDTGVKSQTDVIGVTSVYTGSSASLAKSTFNNTASGSVQVTATDIAADAVGFYFGPTVFNSGHIQVVSQQADAWGVVGEPFTNASTGTLEVQAADHAVGVNYSWSDGGAFSNAGLIEVTGLHAIGVEGMTSFNNSGSLKAIGVGTGATSAAVFITAPYGVTYTNSGLIQGDYAFLVDSTFLGGQFPDVSITNTGTINGKISLENSFSQIHNSGAINGAIQFGDGNSVYDGAQGTQSGGIYLGHGANTVTLGNDGEAVYGGGGSDTVTGGAGNDFIEIARGTNAINGGGGFNTLSLADAAQSYTVDLGAGTATAGTGTSSLQNIQQVVGSSFGDTLIAGSTAATLISGSGNSILRGGAGADTMVAGTGGDTMTGGGGNDSFVYSAGDHQLVITDFGANGNQDVLHIYGYTSAGSVQQQGADTLITLSGSDSVLLKNVQTSALTGGNVVYSAGAYAAPALPASLPIFGTRTIYFTYDLTIASAETINESGQSIGFVDVGGGSPVQPALHSLDNKGVITISVSSGDVSGLVTDISAQALFGQAITNEAGAHFSVSDTAAAGTAKGLYLGFSPTVVNGGTFSVTAAGDAYGIDASSTNGVTNQQSGIFTVVSSGGDAYGIYAGNDATQTSGGIVNAGTLNVTGAHSVYGIRSDQFDFSAIVNSGTISVSGQSGAANTYGIYVEALPVSTASTINNSGTITAQTAIKTVASGDSSAPIIITNSGAIHGVIQLASGNDQIHNTGSIAGTIYFGDGDNVYDGAQGTQSGGIYLGHGANTITLGNDGETVFGGGGSDIITGAAGDDFIEIGRGTNTIDGGGGFNTLSLADADLGYTVNLGAGTAVGAGASTIHNIQRVVGSSVGDTLIAGATAATLISGSGHSVLTGGAGNDTLVAGTGGDTMTGGGGNNSFVYSAGDHQLVITDFGANGDQDVLNIYGYASASAVQQQGGDTLITLSGSDTILLKNVQASSLTGGKVVYSASAYVGPALPASPPVFFSSTAPVQYSYDLTLYAGEALNIVSHTSDLNTNQNIGLEDIASNRGGGAASLSGHALDNSGAISVTSADPTNLFGLLLGATQEPVEFTNRNAASFAVSDTAGPAEGVSLFSSAATVVNAGSFTVSALGDALGIFSGGAITNSASGVLTVTSTADDAQGIDALFSANVQNDGHISVTAAGDATGLLSGFSPGVITNNGTISAQSSGPNGHSYGIDISGPYNPNLPSSITNTGTITAQIALLNEDSGSGFAPLNVLNSVTGIMHGDINLGGSDSGLTNNGQITGNISFSAVTLDVTQLFIDYASRGFVQPTLTNAGHITGNVSLNGGNATVTDTGTITGNILLSDGNDTIDLRGGSLTGSVIVTPTIAGKNTSDTIYLADGGGVVDLHNGDNNLAVTIVGGGGNDTVVFDGARSNYSITTTQRTTRITPLSGQSGPTAILSNVESAQFSDQTVTLPTSTITYPDGSIMSAAIVLPDNNTQLKVATGTATQAGVISESGGSFGLAKVGAGTLIFTGSNSYTGATAISDGTLQIGNGGTSGSLGAGAVIDVTALVFDRQDVVTVNNAISGSGSLTQIGSGGIILTGANSYSGTTVISAGVIQVGNGGSAGSLGTAAVTDNASLAFDRSDNIAVANVISGSGNLIQEGHGILTLTGAETYTGATTIQAGTLALSGAGSIANSSQVNDSGAFDISAADTSITSLSGSGTVFLGGRTLTITNGVGGVFSGGIQDSGINGGISGSLVLASGTQILAGANSYTGNTTITAGSTLQLGNGTGSSVSVAGNIVDNGELDYNGTSTMIYAGSVTGSGSLHMIGSGGEIVLTGASNFSGGTVISHGAVMIGNQTATGSLGGNVVDGDVTSNVTLAFNRTDDYTFGGNISGLGEVDQDGAGKLTLSGTNTYSGVTDVLQGILAISSDANLGTGPVIVSGTVQFLAPVTSAKSYEVAGSSSTLRGAFDTNGNNVTLSGVLSSPVGINIPGGYGGFTKIGAGTLTLTGNNTYGGSTVISQGTLAVSGDGNLGHGFVELNGGTFQFLSSATSALNYQFLGNSSADVIDTNGNNVTISGVVSTTSGANVAGGSGGFTKAGAGTLTFTKAETYTGATIIGTGTLALSGTGSIAASASVDDNSIFDISQTTGTSITTLFGSGTIGLGGQTLTISNGSGLLATSNFSGVIQDGGIAGGDLGKLAITGGAELLTGANTYSGGTSIASGATLVIGHNAATGSLGSGAVTDNGTLVYGLSAPTTLSNAISGAGEFEQLGSGTLTFAIAETYTGETVIGAGATLALSGAGSIAGSAFVGDAGGTFDISGTSGNVSVKGLADLIGSSGNIVALGGNGLTITVGPGYAFSGVIQDGGIAGGSGGGLTINGGLQGLTGANTYTGVTTIASGAQLAIGNGGTTGSLGSGVVHDNGLLFYSLTNTVTVGNVITGTGVFDQFGSGNVILTATEGYSGATNVLTGTLTVDGSIASSSGVTVASGARLAGTGTVGSTSVQSGGTLAPGDAGIGTLHVNGNLTLASGSTYAEDLSPTTTDLTLISGTASLAGTLSENFAGGTYNVGQTYTILTSTGALSGGFTGVSHTGLAPGLQAVLSYDAHDVFLTIQKTASADFNADGNTDILWQNDAGQAAVWLMNGTSLTSAALVGPDPGMSWHVVGAGDLNGDGKTDILWQNDAGQAAVWLMDGTNLTSAALLGSNPGTSWHVVGAGDLNGDGKTDILWQNDAGQAAVWLMDGANLTSAALLGSNPGTTWHVKGAGDFNGDGKTDILWQNDAGQAAVWLMDGTNLTSAAVLGPNPGTTWHVKGAGDFNGDGKTDILWQNDAGQAAVWLMDGTNLTSAALLGSNPGTTWHVVT